MCKFWYWIMQIRALGVIRVQLIYTHTESKNKVSEKRLSASVQERILKLEGVGIGCALIELETFDT